MHAEDCGVDVDRRREIHDLGDLGLEMDDGEGDQAEKGDGDEKIEVKYRSMFERKAFKGTELVYGNLESDRQILEGIV